MEETVLNSSGEFILNWLDITIIALYFFALFSVTLLTRWKYAQDERGYFLGGGDMTWITIGASLFASNIGSGHIIGLAGSAAATGIGVAGFEQSATFVILILGWLFVPVYISAEVYSVPQYMKKRFASQRIQLLFSLLSVLFYIFIKISVDVYAAALFLHRVMGQNDAYLYITLVILLVITAVITVFGGFKAVMWTDLFQVVLIIVGATILMSLSLNEVGGLDQLIERYPIAVPRGKLSNGPTNSSLKSTCGNPPKTYMLLLQEPGDHESKYPWTGMIFGLGINSIWYWCADQVMVQRMIASRNILQAKGGCVLAAYLKFLPLWLLVIPGMAARVLYTEDVACASPESCRSVCGNPWGCSNIAFTELVLKLMPAGLRGLMVVAVMAALTSTLTSVVSSLSTIFTMDVWIWARREFSSVGEPPCQELVVVGRVFSLVVIVLSFFWIPVVNMLENPLIFDYIQKTSSFLVPPVSAVCILAVFLRKTTEQGAFWGLIVGLTFGMLRAILELIFPVPPCGSDISSDVRPKFIRLLIDNVHYLHYSGFLWVVTSITIVAISIFTRPIPSKALHRLTFWTWQDTRFPEIPQLEPMDIDQATKNVTQWKLAFKSVLCTRRSNKVEPLEQVLPDQTRWICLVDIEGELSEVRSSLDCIEYAHVTRCTEVEPSGGQVLPDQMDCLFMNSNIEAEHSDNHSSSYHTKHLFAISNTEVEPSEEQVLSDYTGCICTTSSSEVEPLGEQIPPDYTEHISTTSNTESEEQVPSDYTGCICTTSSTEVEPLGEQILPDYTEHISTTSNTESKEQVPSDYTECMCTTSSTKVEPLREQIPHDYTEHISTTNKTEVEPSEEQILSNYVERTCTTSSTEVEPLGEQSPRDYTEHIFATSNTEVEPSEEQIFSDYTECTCTTSSTENAPPKKQISPDCTECICTTRSTENYLSEPINPGLIGSLFVTGNTAVDLSEVQDPPNFTERLCTFRSAAAEHSDEQDAPDCTEYVCASDNAAIAPLEERVPADCTGNAAIVLLEEQVPPDRNERLAEPSFWKCFVNINATICIILSVIVYSLFSEKKMVGLLSSSDT